MSIKTENCPSCKKEVEYVEFECDAPFTAPFELRFQALYVWGAFDVAKEKVCHSLTKDGDFVHFKFLANGSERLVKMLDFDREKFAQNLEKLQTEKKPCEHKDENGDSICQAEGSPIFTVFEPNNPIAYYCDSHCFENGACPGCYQFLAGFESFDFSQTGFCEGCSDDFSEGFDDDDDDEYNYGDDEW